MTRINFILMLALLVSGLYLVRCAHDVRLLFAELDKARALANQLAADHGHLSTEIQSQATPLKIERVARAKLNMRTATVAVTHYVTYSSASEMAP